MWLALFVGAALAPTDAALGLPVATPVVMLAIAGAAAAAGLENAEGAGRAAVELLIGVAIGAAVGGLGGWVLAGTPAALPRTSPASPSWRWPCSPRGGADAAWRRFRRGLLWSLAFAPRPPLFLAVVWMAFGGHRHPHHARPHQRPDRRVRRAQPHRRARAPGGGGLDQGWAGPPHGAVRGLVRSARAGVARCSHCSRSKPSDPRQTSAVAVIALTVLLSVLTHGLSAAPLARRYGEACPSPAPNQAAPNLEAPTVGAGRR